MNSDRIMCRIAVIDMADRVMTRVSLELPSTVLVRNEYTEYLRDRVLQRISDGYSMDCDELRALSDLDKSA